MKIAILGTRGIPNNYGGFEQFAEYLSRGLTQYGHEVYVYNSHNHPYQEKAWNGVNIIHKFDPEFKVGTAGQFVYDLNCILDSRKRKFDIIYQLGYTSSSIWNKFLPKKPLIVTNMDGLEWKRSKYPAKVQQFLKYAEKSAALSSDYLVADSIGIKKHILNTYGLASFYLPYGANVYSNPDVTLLQKYSLEPNKYDILVARIEPENSIETIIAGFAASNYTNKTLVVIGNTETKYGKYIRNKFPIPNIKYLGAIYDINVLNSLRYFSNIYFHGHTVGGTNPSLLEAMASGVLLCANDNIFNRAILGDDAYYFTDSLSVSKIMNLAKITDRNEKIEANVKKIAMNYTWEKIVSDYEQFFKIIYKSGKRNIHNFEKPSAPADGIKVMVPSNH